MQIRALLSILAITALLLTGLGYNQLNAQDIHFSQFYASPLNLNPALTGMMNAHYRVSGIYRNQWRSINKEDPFDEPGEFDPSKSFVTYSGSFDIQPLFNKMKKDIFGVGVTLYNDKAGNGGLGTLSPMLSAAYHKHLGSGNFQQYLGIGIQGGFIQRTINFDELIFSSQYDVSTGNFTNPLTENFGDGSSMVFDMGAGLNYQALINEKHGAYLGFSMFHLTQPTESFLGQDNSLKMRPVISAGGRIAVAENMFVTPNMIFMMQGGAKEVNFGTGFEYHIQTDNSPIVLGAGAWYRLGDAAIASLNMEIKNIRIGAAYDFTVSDLSAATNGNGGFEISLIYMGNFSGSEAPVVVPCPRM